MKKNTYITLSIICTTIILLCTFLNFKGSFVSIPILQKVREERPSLPVAMIIPKLDIETEIEHVGVTKAGEMETPLNSMNVGWYRFGTVPGLLGSAVAAGHLDNEDGSPAIFAKLSELVIGDDIYVVNEKQEKLHFKVVARKIYDYNLPNTEEVFGPSSVPRLNLITCNGSWLKDRDNYSKRLVIFTELQET